MKKIVLLTCLVLALSIQGLNAESPSLLVHTLGDNHVSIFDAGCSFVKAIAQGFVAIFSPCLIVVKVVIIEIYSQTSGFEAFAAMFQGFNINIARVTSTSSSYRASISGASNLEETSKTMGYATSGFFAYSMNSLGYLQTSLAAVAAGEKPNPPDDHYYDEASDESSPDLSGFPATGSPNIGVQAKALVAYSEYTVKHIQKISLHWENLRKETHCDCDNVMNTANVQNVIEAWNDVSVIASRYTSSTESGILISRFDQTEISQFRNAMYQHNELINNLPGSSANLVGAMGRGDIKIRKSCTLDNGKSSEEENSGAKGGNSKQLNPDSTCQTREKHSTKRQQEITKLNSLIIRREKQTETKSFFHRCVAQVKEYTSHLVVNFVRYQYRTVFIFNPQHKEYLKNFESSIKRFIEYCSSIYETNINKIQQIILKAQKSIFTKTNEGYTTVDNKYTELDDKLLAEAYLYPCCKDFRKTSLTIYQTAIKNISSCNEKADETFNGIYLSFTNVLAKYADAFEYYKEELEECLQSKCIIRGYYCCNWLWYITDIEAVGQCIKYAIEETEEYLDNHPATANAVVTDAQTNADKATQDEAACVDEKVAYANAAFVKQTTDYEKCKSNGCAPTTTTTKAPTPGPTPTPTAAPLTYADDCAPTYWLGPPNWAALKAKYPSGTLGMHYGFCPFGKFYDMNNVLYGVYLDCCY